MFTQKGNSTAIAVSIVASGVLIAGALFIALGSGGGRVAAGNNLEPRTAPRALRDITESDHIFGNPDAAITIVEFSDFECPFCSRLHPTLKQIVEGNDDVKWVYRHFPLVSFHTRAYAAAHASECVAELAGNDAFWDFSTSLFDNQSSLGTELYERLAGEVGVSVTDFRTCTDSNRHEDRIQADLRESQQTGGQGTPYSIAINSDGQALPFSGALPFETIQQIVEALR
ncbi:MAG: thioredoxin domain-containing protein [Candidatus Pacebacteria bacterium]|nr:thioredoxin domain-containing protein [Candidatus Paceibacterota bacterium]